MDAKFDLVAYTPADAEEISGLTTGMQRDFRRRGILPPVSGHARFDPFEVADLRLLKLLSDGGLGPAAGARQWKRAVAFCIVSRALLSPNAYSRPVENIESIRKLVLLDAVGRASKSFGKNLPAGAHSLILRTPRFAVWWAQESISAGDSLDDLYARRARPGGATLPAIVLDLHGAAEDFLRLAGFLVELEA